MQLKKLLQFALLLLAGPLAFAQGACPANLPVTGNHCYFIAASGSDSNNGTSESTPFLHAPGMSTCTSNCAAVSPAPGEGFIVRGGDTYHFGNSGDSPYTGGNWAIGSWAGGTCDLYSSTSGCIYWGVDTTWFSGSSWSRPILNADNPTNTSLVSSCPYQTGGSNNMVTGYNGEYLDNFELVGMCSSRNPASGSPATDITVAYGGTGNFIETNLYIHGWTATTAAGTSNSTIPCTLLGGSTQSTATQTIEYVVIDGSDSVPGACAWATFPMFTHFAYNYISHTTQGVGQGFHDVHDNIFEYIAQPDLPTHGNVLEFNHEAGGSTPNVFYRNTMRHILPGFFSTGQVGWWFCPNTTPDFWFDNVAYDTGGIGDGNAWAVAGIGQYPDCTNTGKQYMFNNSFSGFIQPCHLSGSNPTGGQYLYVYNEHLMNTPYDGTGCNGGAGDSSNVFQAWSVSDAQGYTSGSAGITDADTCNSLQCAPVSSAGSTINAGHNEIATYCATLQGFAGSDSSMGTAATACALSTSNGCSYNTSSHTVQCPNTVATSRPSSGAWDAGAYQYNGAPPPATPVASISPSTLPFGNQATGTTGGPLTVTLSNTGNASLLITQIISSSGEFAKVTDQCQATFAYSLPAGQQCTVTVSFTPNALGPQTGTLTFTDNSGGNTGTQQTVPLTGTGTSAGLWSSAASTPNFTVSWSSAGTTQTCTATQSLTTSQPAILVWWGWVLGSAPTFNAVSGDSLANISGIFQAQPAAAGGKYMFSGGASEASASGGSTTGSVTINTTSASGNFDCEIVQPVISSGTAILDATAAVSYQGCTAAAPCISPSLALSGNDYAIVWGAKGNPAPMAPAAPWTTPADIDSSNQYGGAFGALNQSSYSAFTFGPVSSTDYESISALSFGQSAALTVAVSPSGAGTLSQCSSGNYPNGKQLTCTITPASGYVQSSWSGVSGCSGNSCTFNMNGTTSVTAILTAVSYTLTQVISPASSGTVSGLHCGSGMYTGGTTIGPCTATPAASYAFAGWSGGGCSGTSTCTVASLSANTTLTATFTPTGGGSYTWTPTISPVASGTLAGTHCAAGTYTSGTTIGACTATPATGYAFDDWSSVSGSAGCSGATNPCASFAISSNSAATANFTQTSYTLGTTTSGTGTGTATPSSTSLHYGDAYTITVTPDAGSIVTSVAGCGVSPTPPYTGTMTDADCDVAIVFSLENFAWTPLINPPGAGQITGTNSVGGSFPSGTAIGALTPTPALGYSFLDWSSDVGSAPCSGSTVPCGPFDLDEISGVTANFVPQNFTISVSISGSGTVTGCAGPHAYQSIYTCTATPAAGFYLQSISGCGGSGGTAFSGATPATDCNIPVTFGAAQAGGTATQMLESQ